MINQESIWIVEDDEGSRFVYEDILSFRYKVTLMRDLSGLRAEMSKGVWPDVLIADLRLPDGNFLTALRGEEWVNPLRQRPFIIVSQLDDVDALRFCLQAGAADYLTKPFSRSELIVKLERVLAGARASEMPGASTGQIFMDPTSQCAQVENGRQSPPLTSKEFQIMSVLSRAGGRPVAKDELLRHVWGATRVTSNTLDVHLFNLRRKVVAIGLDIQHVSPDGYKLSSDRMN